MKIRVSRGESASKAKKYIEKKIQSDMLSLAEGIVKVGNVPTKHYLGEEFESQLLHFNMETVQRSKLEYEWETEIENPPRGLVGPYPFD